MTTRIGTRNIAYGKAALWLSCNADLFLEGRGAEELPYMKTVPKTSLIIILYLFKLSGQKNELRFYKYIYCLRSECFGDWNEFDVKLMWLEIFPIEKTSHINIHWKCVFLCNFMSEHCSLFCSTKLLTPQNRKPYVQPSFPEANWCFLITTGHHIRLCLNDLPSISQNSS